MDGMINIYKEQDYTSHDVVARLRGILKQKKIGHTGTLDPMAEGVLPVCLGKGTKLCDLLADRSKTYETVMHLGITTDTEDMTGTVLTRQEVVQTEEQVIAAVNSFVGQYEQVPPMYSAKKVNGKKLYELARQGQVIERKPVQVEIKKITIKEIALPLVKFEVECSKGTYIRSLCRDIGEKLGCGAAMEQLLRTRVGEFHLSDAKRLSEIEQLVATGQIDSVIKPVDEAFLQYPKVVVPSSLEKKVDNGNSFFLKAVREPGDYRIYKENGMFIGIYTCQEDRLWTPRKLFFVEGSND